MSTRYKVLCGVPYEHCKGSTLITDQHFSTNAAPSGANKCHVSHEDAFKCMANYLTSVLGFTRISSREFQNPDNGPIRILTRQSKYGAHLRTGKLQQRYMPEPRDSKSNHGVIIG